MQQNHEKNKIFTIFLLTVLLSLTGVIFYYSFLKDRIETPPQSPSPRKIIPLAPDNIILPSDVDRLRQTVDKLESQNKTLSDQVWLLGLQANQNAVMLKLAHPENANGVAELTEDWKLNKIPDSIKIKESHLNRLKQFIADKGHATQLNSAEMPSSYEE